MKFLALIPSLAVIVFIFACIAGWIMNTVAVMGSNFSEFTLLLAVRLLGIVMPPLGAVLGYV